MPPQGKVKERPRKAYGISTRSGPPKVGLLRSKHVDTDSGKYFLYFIIVSASNPIEGGAASFFCFLGAKAAGGGEVSCRGGQ